MLNKRARILICSTLLCGVPRMGHAQTGLPVTEDAASRKRVIVAPEAKSDSVIAVPPATSVTVRLGTGTTKDAASIDLSTWLHKESGLNGLASTSMQPWHIVITYDQFDEDGDNVHSGVYKETWAGPEKYRRSYESDNVNQTDFATERGLFRSGDQQWPGRAESQVRSEIIDPFYYGATLQGFRGRNVEETFGGYSLQCVKIEKESSVVSDPTQYCFEPGGSVLRYARGFGWFQTVYNGIVTFQGRNVARDVEVTDGGKPYLKLLVETIEIIQHVNEAEFVPPPGAVGLRGKRVSGVNPSPVKMSFPRWPASLRGQHFSVTVEILIGKDGHVVSAHAVTGPPEAYKTCEDAVRKWIYTPYIVLNEPVEVETRVLCSLN